jgi:DNA-binding NarL/FixJ family response regulator
VSVRILIADDFEGWRLEVRTLLQIRTEWQIVSEARDGLEVVQKASKFHPDVVLLDIGMPGLNGIAAAAQIRQLSPNSKIIFVTANSDSDVIHEAQIAGLDGYVLKFQAGTELIPAIEEALCKQPLSP